MFMWTFFLLGGGPVNLVLKICPHLAVRYYIQYCVHITNGLKLMTNKYLLMNETTI
jgi:hypothetical protein